MFQDNELKLKLYLYPVFFFTLGTIAFLNIGWEKFGAVMFVLGFVSALHVIVVSVIREGRYQIDADRERTEEQRKLYETVMKMDAEARYVFGLGYVPKEVTAKIVTDNKVTNEYSQVWQKLPLAPYKLKVVAQAAINGEGFTVRKWAGDGKLLSREEWDATHKKMLELGMLEPAGSDPREGFIWTGLGMDVMAQVVKDTL